MLADVRAPTVLGRHKSGTFLCVGFSLPPCAVWCVPALWTLRVPLVHSLINHFRQKSHFRQKLSPSTRPSLYYQVTRLASCAYGLTYCDTYIAAPEELALSSQHPFSIHVSPSSCQGLSVSHRCTYQKYSDQRRLNGACSCCTCITSMLTRQGTCSQGNCSLIQFRSTDRLCLRRQRNWPS